MSAEDVALEEFRRAAKLARSFQYALRVDPESFTLRSAANVQRDAVHRLALVVRAIRAEKCREVRDGGRTMRVIDAVLVQTTDDGAIRALDSWYAEERDKHGLVDVKFFPGDGESVSVGDRARAMLRVLTTPSVLTNDMTEEEI